MASEVLIGGLLLQLARSMVQGKAGAGGGHEVSNVRTSKTAWLPETIDPLLPRLSRRIRMLTGLRTDPLQDEAELLQVISFCYLEHMLCLSPCLTRKSFVTDGKLWNRRSLLPTSWLSDERYERLWGKLISLNQRTSSFPLLLTMWR